MKTNLTLKSHEKRSVFSLKKLIVIGIAATLLLLTGCGPQEKPPVDDPKEDPIVSKTEIETYLKKDTDVVTLNGKQITVKQAKEEHGYLYHMLIDYSDEEVNEIYEEMLYLSLRVHEYHVKNWDKIKLSQMPLLDAFGFVDEKVTERIKTVSELGTKTNEEFKILYEDNDQNIVFSPYKEFIEKQGENYLRTKSLDTVEVNSEELIKELMKNSISHKRTNIGFYLMNFQMFMDYAEKNNYKPVRHEEVAKPSN